MLSPCRILHHKAASQCIKLINFKYNFRLTLPFPNFHLLWLPSKTFLVRYHRCMGHLRSHFAWFHTQILPHKESLAHTGGTSSPSALDFLLPPSYPHSTHHFHRFPPQTKQRRERPSLEPHDAETQQNAHCASRGTQAPFADHSLLRVQEVVVFNWNPCNKAHHPVLEVCVEASSNNICKFNTYICTYIRT